MAIVGGAVYGTNGYGDQPEHRERGEAGHILWFFQLDIDGDGVLDSHTLPVSIRAVEFARGVTQRHDPRAFGPSQPEREFFTVEILDKDGVWWNSPERAGLANLTTGRAARLNAISTTTKAPAQAIFSGVLREATYDPRAGVILFKGNGMADTLILGEAAELRDDAIPYNSPLTEPFLPGSGAPVPIRHWRGEAAGTGPKALTEMVLNACGLPVKVECAAREEETPEYFTLTGGSGWNALRSICAGFMTRVEFDREGNMSLRRLAEATDEPAELAEDLTAGAISERIPAPGVINSVNARVRPLYCPPLTYPIAFDEYRVAWRAAGPVEVKPGETKLIDIRFPKTIGNVFAANFTRVNSDSALDPDPFTVNSAADKNGVDMGASDGTGEASFYIRSEPLYDESVPYTLYQNYGGKQDQCRIVLGNVSDTRTAYYFNLRLYAAGLSQQQEVSAYELVDAESAAAFGKRVARVSTPLCQSREFAEQCANDALTYFRSPDRANVSTASLVTTGDQILQTFDRFDLGKLIQIPANNSLVAGMYRVLGGRTRWLSPHGQISRHEIYLEKAIAPPVTIDRSSATVVVNAASVQWTQTDGTRAGEYLLVAIARRSLVDDSTVSVDGLPLIRLARISLDEGMVGEKPSVELWGGFTEAGAGELDVAFGAADWAECFAVSVVGADPQTPVRWVKTNTSDDSQASLITTISESDLLISLAGFKQTTQPLTEQGAEISHMTSDGNWRATLASATGLRQAICAWSGITGGAAIAGAVISAKWHNETNF